MRKKTTEEFIRDARMVHGDKFDYSLVDYKGNKIPVEIICPIHGPFFQRPVEHLRGSGCPDCAMEARSMTKQEFINRANHIHNNKYSYIIENDIVLTTDFIVVVCPIHGEFSQKVGSHISGQGCRKCSIQSRKTKIYGVGVNDTNIPRRSIVYRYWAGFLRRCYSQEWLNKHPAYIGCSVCPEWHYLSNFKRWFDENYIEGYDLDKDILVKGNKIYSPDTCCFVPQEINKLLLRKESQRGDCPIGVSQYGDKFVSRGSIDGKVTYLGSFHSPEAAFLAYKKAKEQYVIVLAEKYFKEGKITERVYRALLDYRVEITD